MTDQDQLLAFTLNGGATGARMRARDWSGHPLGALAQWPSALRTTLGTVLGSSFPTFVTWGEANYLFHNDAYLPMLGKRADSTLGQPYEQVWSEVWADLGPYVARVKDGESFFFENYATTLYRNGAPEQTWFTFSFSPVRDEAGLVRGMLCTVIEVTDKVLALARHKEAEERLALSLEASGNIGTWSVDLETATTHVDERFARLFQLDAAVAMAGTDLVRFTDMIHAEDRPHVLAAIDRAINDETLYDTEYRIPQRSGLDVWINARGKVFTSLETGRRQFAGIAIDVTERKLAERRRIESEQAAAEASMRAAESARRMEDSETRFRLMADDIPQIVWAANAAGINDYINTRWFEYTGEPLPRRPDWDWRPLIHPDDLPLLEEAWRACLATGHRFEIEHRLWHHTGQFRWVLNRAVPSTDAIGPHTRWLGTLTDIHDKKTGEEELRTQSRRKDEFLAMLAHELRNPLAPISTAAHMLALGRLDAEQARRSSEVIVRQVRHMTSLVDDLLDVSRVTRGLVELEREVVDLPSVLASAIEQVRPLVDARGHVLAVDMADAADAAGGLPLVHGDRVRLVQVVTNLLNNAAKYTPPNGRIAVSVTAGEGSVAIAVCDNGVGIAADVLPHVFELFTQAERTPDRSQGGLGIGLALVHSLVQLHGGTVCAASAGLGQGSTFTVTLPALAEMPAPA
ncbi:PAS domain-containing sensor histidine kinase [Pseudoduganella lutea]|uniref:PAS domain-containing sensor histidine kinase n=1 Tax=Pseudoduganella lutea TaxID=321985 RepID=UPI0013EE8005|nr:PAS domain-containing sensor histidine kinase [Pseudoduganella lutea]